MEKILRKQLQGGVFKDVPIARSKLMRAVKGKRNKSTELKFRLALVRARISGWKMHYKIEGNPDIFFPSYRVAIFLDGCFWHGCPNCGHIPKTNSGYWKAKLERNIERDLKKTEILKKLGYLVIRFWEHELSEDLDGCVQYVISRIEETLSNSIYINDDYFVLCE